MHRFPLCMLFCLQQVLDTLCACVQHWTQVIAASNTYRWLNVVLNCRFGFARRFPCFISSDTCFDTYACCQTHVSQFCGSHRPFSRGLPRRLSFPFACRLHRVVLLGFSAFVCFPLCMSTYIAWFYRRFILLPVFALGQ